MNPPPSSRGRPPRAQRIIPAVPRAFERKPKPVKQQSQSNRNEGHTAVLVPELVSEAHEETSGGAAQDLKIEISGVIQQGDGKQEDASGLVFDQGDAQHTNTESSMQAFRLGIPSPSLATDSSQISSTHTTPTVNQDGGSLQNPQKPRSTVVFLHRGKVREEGFDDALQHPSTIVRNDPVPSTNAISSPAQSQSQDSILSQSVDSSSHPTPSNDPTKFPPPSSLQGDNQSQSASRYEDNAPSSNPGSSPTHSVYQGYTFGPPYQAPNVFLASGDARSPYGPYYDPRLNYHIQPPYWGRNQHPLTPSATPLDPAPQRQCTFGDHRPSITSDARSLTTVAPSDHPTKQDVQNRVGHEQAHPTEIDPSINDGRPNPFNSLNSGRSTGPEDRDDISQLSIGKHLLLQFNIDTYADCRLIISHEMGRFSAVTFSLHGVLIIRSRRISRLFDIGEYHYDSEAKKVFQLRLNDHFVTPEAMGTALRVCYGEDASNFTGSAQKAQPPRSKAELSTTLMDESLAFAAAGDFLGLKSVVLRGLEIASKVLNWDNLERALHFALEYGSHRAEKTSLTAIAQSPHHQPPDSDSSPSTNTMLTPNSSQMSTNGPSSVKCSKTEILNASEKCTQEPSNADELLSLCIRFLISNFPSSWQFDPTVKPLPVIDRLPVTPENNTILSSRLNKIQFGEFPPEHATDFSDHDRFLSSLLISLPFSSLEFLTSMGAASVNRNLHALVSERERRRQNVLQSQSVTPAQRAAAQGREWTDIGYKETVEDGEGVTVRLSRHFTGIYQNWTDPAVTEHQEPEA